MFSMTAQCRTRFLTQFVEVKHYYQALRFLDRVGDCFAEFPLKLSDWYGIPYLCGTSFGGRNHVFLLQIGQVNAGPLYGHAPIRCWILLPTIFTSVVALGLTEG